MCQNLKIIFIGCGRGAKNISTKQYRLGQYKVTTINLFKKQRPTKISQFSLKPTKINTWKRKAVWNKNQINSFGTLI